MVTGYVHEYLKELLRTIVRAVTMGRDIDCVGAARRRGRQRLEALRRIRLTVSSPKRSGWRRQPWPGCRKTRPTIPVPIWRSRSTCLLPRWIARQSIRISASPRCGGSSGGRVLIIEQLQADGSYASVEESRFLEVRPEDILRWLNEAATEGAATWSRRLIQWAMGSGHQA